MTRSHNVRILARTRRVRMGSLRHVPDTVAVVIRCYNEEAHIGRLLTGIERQTVRPDEVIVVDSGSTDATLSIASAFDVRVISIAPEHFSFGHAPNLGIDSAASGLCVMASAHVYPVYDTWLERLVAPFEEPDIACVYGRQETPPNARFSEARVMEQWFPPKSVRRQREPFCNNANAAIRRSVWEGIRYDEQLTGLEDLDWAKRAMDAGYALSYVAEAPVIHVHDESFSETRNRYRREAIAHKEIYQEQNISWQGALKMLSLNIAGDLREARRAGEAAKHVPDIVRFRAAQFLGTYQGFRQSGPVTEVLKRRFYYPAASASQPPPSASEIGRPIDYEEPRPDVRHLSD